jgi:hypothetical protein
MKYKVGDKVRVRDDLVIDKFYGNGYRFIAEMARYKGQIVTISRVCHDFYKVKDDIYYLSWVDEMFEEKETKYKVGDKVRVRTDLVEYGTYGGVTYVDEMGKWAGDVVTISRINENGHYEIAEDKEDEDSDKWTWSDEMFEDVPMKYKIGDRVRVRKDLVHGKAYGGQTFYMDDWKGKVVTISSVTHGYYEIADDKDEWWWSDEMFEDVADVPTDGKVQTVDVGYYLAFCGHRVLVDVYQDGVHDGKPFFTSADGFNQYLLQKDAIEWVIPHEREIDL